MGKTKITKKDFVGNMDFKITAGESMPLGNLCSICGKCVHCEHPYWECPKLTEIKSYAP